MKHTILLEKYNIITPLDEEVEYLHGHDAELWELLNADEGYNFRETVQQLFSYYGRPVENIFNSKRTEEITCLYLTGSTTPPADAVVKKAIRDFEYALEYCMQGVLAQSAEADGYSPEYSSRSLFRDFTAEFNSWGQAKFAILHQRFKEVNATNVQGIIAANTHEEFLAAVQTFIDAHTSISTDWSGVVLDAAKEFLGQKGMTKLEKHLWDLSDAYVNAVDYVSGVEQKISLTASKAAFDRWLEYKKNYLALKSGEADSGWDTTSLM